MNPHRAGHLRQPADRLFHLVARHHHQVGQLVDHHHDERQRTSGLALLGHFARLEHRAHIAVELFDVAHAVRRQRLVALFHLAHRPAQRVRGLLRFHHHRRHQVRDVLVHAQLEPLWIHHDHPHIVRGGAIEDAGENGIEPDRLAGTSRAGNQQVGHGGQIGHEWLAVNGLAERKRQLRSGTRVILRFQQFAQRDRFAVRVWNLDADGGLPRNAIDQHRLRLHGEAEVVGEAGHLRIFHAGVWLELERGHDRPGVNLHHGTLDRKLAALLLEQAGRFHQLALVDLALGLRRIEQRDRRQGVRTEPAFEVALGLRQRQGRRHGHPGRGLLDDRRRASGRGERWLVHPQRRAAIAPRCHQVRPFNPGGFLVGLVLARLRGWHAVLLAVLHEHFAPLLRLAALFAPQPERRHALRAQPLGRGVDRTEQPAEGDLRGDDDGGDDQSQDDDHRSRLAEVISHDAAEPFTQVAAGAERARPEVDAAKRQAQKRTATGQQHDGADDLGVRGVDLGAPEIMPARHGHHRRQQVRRVADQLDRQLAEERAHAAGEIGRHVVRPGAEEPDRVVRVVGRQRDQPDQRHREQRDANHLTDAS